MIIYNKNKYQETISEKSIQNIERARGIKCLFGGAFATCVYGINNRAIDFDFYLIYDKCKNEMAKTFSGAISKPAAPKKETEAKPGDNKNKMRFL